MRSEEKNKKLRQARRARRIRSKIEHQSNAPRLTVFRSNKHIYAQVIDDVKGKTIVSVSEKEVEIEKINKTEKAKAVGMKLAEKAKLAKVKNVVFDKGSYKYHGRVKALADGAREGGLIF
jgi:large subunit ribosomal protein L18